MEEVTVSDVARALLALDQNEEQLRQQQLDLANHQYQVWLKLEAIQKAKAALFNQGVNHDRSRCSDLFGVRQP